MKGSVSEPSEHVVGFSSVELVVAAVSCHHTFIIIIHDLIMPNSDFKYYAVGVVPCNSQKKHLLQMISCGHEIVYNGPLLFLFIEGSHDETPLSRSAFLQ